MKKIFTYTLFIQLALVVFPIVVKAQEGIIRGTVRSQNGDPVPFASVLVKELNRGTKTDEKGHYQFTKIDSGEYVVAASFVGYETVEKPVRLSHNAVTLEFTLTAAVGHLSEVVITTSHSMNEVPATIGKVAIKPLDLPQSVMVIGKEVLKQQQALHLSDVLKNANGVYQMGNTGGFQEEIAGRGFSYGSSNTFKNGARFNNGVMPEVSSLERVEVLKGSNAILFGNVAPGGVLNLVTKKPKFENGGEISMRIGSNRFYKPAFDTYGAINNSQKLAYRVNGTYENASSFRKGVSSERFYVNPSFLLKASARTEILVEGDFMQDTRTPDYGTGAINYTIANVPRELFLGASWAEFNATQRSLSTSITHRLNRDWNIRGQASLQNHEVAQYGTSRPIGIKPDGTWNRALQRSETRENYYLGQLDLTGKFNTGSIQHTVLAGADLDQYKTWTPAFKIIYDPQNPQVNTYDVINIYDLSAFPQRSDIPEAQKVSLANNRVNRAGIYVQDLVGLTSKIKLLAGLRYTHSETNSATYTYSTNLSKAAAPRSDDAFTPRLGLVLQPTAQMSLFASYANSFNLNNGIDASGSPLAPSFIDQYEVGIKNELFNGALSA
ncbi:MAG TPA: TonB-dependent receptor, partial [Sphingobacteriaceae bacterium]